MRCLFIPFCGRWLLNSLIIGKGDVLLTVATLFNVLLGKRQPAKVEVVGACENGYEGWIATNKGHLDVLRESEWDSQFEPNSVDATSAEHVWVVLIVWCSNSA